MAWRCLHLANAPCKRTLRKAKLHILLVDLVEVRPIVGIVVMRIQLMLINEAPAPQPSDLAHELVEILTRYLGHWNRDNGYVTV